MRLFLTGMPGSGKTYWLQHLAAALHYTAIDMDLWIQEQEQCSIPELFAISEEHFREAERKALQAIISRHAHHVVVSTGGGASCYKDNLQLMKAAGCVLYLEAGIEQLLSNVMQPGTTRPLLAGGTLEERTEKLEALYRDRKTIYEQANITINVAKATTDTFIQALTQYSQDHNIHNR